MKIKYIGPLLAITAMILLLIPRFISESGLDRLGVLAIVVILASVFGIYYDYKKSNKLK
jgi:hypothetical protein